MPLGYPKEDELKLTNSFFRYFRINLKTHLNVESIINTKKKNKIGYYLLMM